MKSAMAFYIFLLISFFSLKANCQDSLLNSSYKKCDSISKSQFDKLTKKYLKKMKSNRVESVGDIINVVKIYITFSFSYYSWYNNKKGIYKEFVDLYRKTYIGKACELLHCTLLKGLVAYSNKYQLFISMTDETMECYNFFVIKNKKK